LFLPLNLAIHRATSIPTRALVRVGPTPPVTLWTLPLVKPSQELPEDCAFEAGYLFATAVVGLEATEEFMHPDVSVLLAVADKLGWPHSAMAPAISQLKVGIPRDETGAQRRPCCAGPLK
jgi:hypothetical protein